MTTREEIQHLSIDELHKVHALLCQCLEILNPDNEKLTALFHKGKDMILNLELAQIVIYERILEKNKK